MSGPPSASCRAGLPAVRMPAVGATQSYLGIDVGGTGIKWSVLAAGRVIQSGSAATPRTGRQDVIDAIVSIVRAAQAGRPSISGVGLALPGVIDTVQARSVFIPNVPGDWSDYPVGREIEAQAGIPVTVLNDARAFGVAELMLGAGRQDSRALFVTLGTGVGGAIALDGRILIGQRDTLGEIGHFLVAPGGELCGCGGRGCLETIASGSAIVAYVTRAVIMSLSPVLNRLCGGHPELLTARLIAEAADENDPWCRDALARAGHYIGVAASSLCMALQLHAVVIGGGLVGAYEHIAPATQEVLLEREALTGRVRVRRADLGPAAGSIGAGLQAAAQLQPQDAASPPIGRKDS